MIPCCYPSLRKCCYKANEGGADPINPSRPMASGGGGGGGIAAVDLCFGSLGRFAMEGGKVMLGCDAERAHWEEEDEEELAAAAAKELPSSPQSTLVGAGFHGSNYGWDSSLISPSSSSSSSSARGGGGGGSGGALSSGVSSPPTPVAPPGGDGGCGGGGGGGGSSASFSGGCGGGGSAYPRELGSDDALDALCAELLRLKTEGEARERAAQQLRQAQQQQQQQQLLLLRQQKHYHHLLHQMRASATEDMEAAALKSQVANQAMPRKQSRGTGYWGQATKQARSSSAIARSSFHYAAAAENTGAIAQPGGAAAPSSTVSHQNTQNMASVPPPTNNGSGMRAIFLSGGGGGGGRNPRESPGTGVFLPRRPDAKSRRPACSTVLLPSRIVHALNLNLEESFPSPSMAAPRDQSIATEGTFWIGRSSSSTGFSVPTSYGIHYNRIESSAQALSPSPSIASITSQRVDNITLQEVAPDISLPTEWIY